MRVKSCLFEKDQSEMNEIESFEYLDWCIPHIRIFMLYIDFIDFYQFQFNTNSFIFLLLHCVIHHFILEWKNCMNSRFLFSSFFRSRRKNKWNQKQKNVPQQIQTHCQCKHKQISFVTYFKIKDNIMLPVVVWLKYGNNIPFNQNVRVCQPRTGKYGKQIQFNHLHNRIINTLIHHAWERHSRICMNVLNRW